MCRITFTFQYGSINTVSPVHVLTVQQSLHSNMVLLILFPLMLIANKCFFFTFQYGSINTHFQIRYFHRSGHLHSNMVLLIRNKILISVLLLFYLHSNMVLLIPSLRSLPSVISTDLHSNMVLLIPRRKWRKSRMLSIYIPIWFY